MFIYMYIFENSSVWTEPICFAYEAERSLLLMGLLDPLWKGRERGEGHKYGYPSSKSIHMCSVESEPRTMSVPPTFGRGGQRKRQRMASSVERGYERMFDPEDRALEDARAIREAMVLWIGAARLLVHLNRGHSNMASMTLQSKKIIATATGSMSGWSGTSCSWG